MPGGASNHIHTRINTRTRSGASTATGNNNNYTSTSTDGYTTVASQEDEDLPPTTTPTPAAVQDHNSNSNNISNNNDHNHHHRHRHAPMEPAEIEDNDGDDDDNDVNNEEDSAESRPPTTGVSIISVDDAIERLGASHGGGSGGGLFQLTILTAAGLAFAADGMQVVLLSFLTLILKDEWSLTSGEAESLTSVLFLGAMVGTLLLGPLADAEGRRPVFLGSALTIGVAGLATAAAPNYGCLLTALFAVGTGVGGLTVPFDILAEFLPAQQRGTQLLKIEYFWTAGCLYVVLLAYLLLNDNDDDDDNNNTAPSWRTFVALCALPCWISLIVGYLCVPESPRWLASQGRCAEALDILRHAAAVNHKYNRSNRNNNTSTSTSIRSRFRRNRDYSVPPQDDHHHHHHDEDEDDDQNHIMDEEDNNNINNNVDHSSIFYRVFPAHLHLREEPEQPHASIADLLAPKWRFITLRLWGAWFFFAFGYFGTILATTRVFASDNDSNDHGGDDDDNDNGSSTASEDFDYSAIFISSMAELVGTTLVIAVVDRVGRVPSQIGSYACAGVLLCVLCVLAGEEQGQQQQHQTASSQRRILLIVLGFGARAFEMAGTCVTWVATAELLTTEVRGTGHSTANAVARIGSFLSPFLVEGSAPLFKVGVVMLVVHAATVLCVFQLPETKGRALGMVNFDDNINDNNDNDNDRRSAPNGAEQLANHHDQNSTGVVQHLMLDTGDDGGEDDSGDDLEVHVHRGELS